MTQQHNRIKGAIFDMDGLIFDSERIVQRSWMGFGEMIGIPDLGNQIYNTIGFNRRRRETYFKSVYGQDFPHELMVEETVKRFQEIVESEGLPVKEGVVELLSFLKEKGIRIGLATSSSEEYAKGNLRDAGLLDYFDGFCFGNMVTHSKPDPEIYLRAAEAVGVDPSECIALEDAPSGILSASRAGMRVIMIPDLVEPTEDLLPLIWHKEPTLKNVPKLVETCL